MKRACRTEAGRIRYTESTESNETKRSGRGGRGGGRGRGGRGAGRILQRRTSARTAAAATKRSTVSLNKEHQMLEELRKRYQNRRNIIFKATCPSRAPRARATFRYLDHIWFNDIKYTVGDIVAITDEEDDEKYFAQLRGIIVDRMMTPYAALTWLFPKREAIDPHDFDPEQFAHGLVDTANHPLNTCEWISERPNYPAYQTTWTTQKIAVSRNRMELYNRWKALVQLAREELATGGQKPLADLIERKNEEIKQPVIPLITHLS